MIALQYWLDFCHASFGGVCNLFGSVSLQQKFEATDGLVLLP